MAKTILITGSSQGIGAGIAKHFGTLGYNVVVTYKKEASLAQKVVDQINTKGRAVAYQLDVTSEESVRDLMDKVAKKFGQLEVLVNNASVDRISPIETTFGNWKEITRTKIDGNFLCTKYALPLLKKGNGANLIVIMSSLGDQVDPDDVAYSVGTAATVAFAKAMALTLAKYGIRTNGVGPGSTKTNSDWWTNIKDPEKTWKELKETNPMGRLTTPEDVAKTVQMIVEDKTNFLNGNFIYINGGSHLK